jgi:hypothetical protein
VALAGASAATAAAPSLPRHCPSATLVKRTLQVKTVRVESRTRTVGAVSQVGGFGAPTSTTPAKPAGQERTCVYTTRAAPVTIVFTTPVTAAGFASARKSFARASKVAVVRGVGDSAWGTADGELFVLRGQVEIVITATGARPAALASLGRAVT